MYRQNPAYSGKHSLNFLCQEKLARWRRRIFWRRPMRVELIRCSAVKRNSEYHNFLFAHSGIATSTLRDEARL